MTLIYLDDDGVTELPAPEKPLEEYGTFYILFEDEFQFVSMRAQFHNAFGYPLSINMPGVQAGVVNNFNVSFSHPDNDMVYVVVNEKFRPLLISMFGDKDDLDINNIVDLPKPCTKEQLVALGFFDYEE